MEIRVVNGKKGHKIELVNDSWSTSNSWGHKTNVLINGCDYGEHKVRYYNRTWEMYTYQTCMSGAIREIMENNITMFLENYKENNGIIRFKKGQKEQLINDYKTTDDLMLDLEQTLQAIRDRNFNITC